MFVHIGVSTVLNIAKDPNKDKLIQYLNYIDKNFIQEYFADKDYGNGLLNLYIGLMIYDPIDIQYLQPRKPRFKKKFVSKSLLANSQIVEKFNVLDFEVWTPYEHLANMNSDNDKVYYIYKQTYNELFTYLKKKKFKDFDVLNFEKDFKALLDSFPLYPD